ncbi:hypothetical protein GCM10010972_04280 [Cellulomonas carbonis]|nr:hypothetical protein GCM10010972_04280 [Cellulomonas carbonis]
MPATTDTPDRVALGPDAGARARRGTVSQVTAPSGAHHLAHGTTRLRPDNGAVGVWIVCTRFTGPFKFG